MEIDYPDAESEDTAPASDDYKPKPQPRESKHAMINRMREMGMVLTMLNIKQKEIAKYEEFANLREEGLRYSESLLN
jgi:hypothetical protein